MRRWNTSCCRRHRGGTTIIALSSRTSLQFRKRHSAESDAEVLADQVQREIDVWHTYSAYYSYVFFVMRLR